MRSNQKKLSGSTRSATLEGNSPVVTSAESSVPGMQRFLSLGIEADLQEELPFRQLMESIGGIFWMMTLERDRMLYISPGCERIWGLTPQSIYKSPWSWLETVHPEDREKIAETTSSRESQENYDVEYRIIRSDGAIRWIHERAFLVNNSAGVPYRWAGIAEDVTERKEAEYALRESEQRYRQFVELCPDPIYIRRGFNFTFVNSAALSLFGVQRAEELIGRSILDFIPPDYVRIVSERTYEMLKAGSRGMMEGKILRLDGAMRDIEAVSAPIDTSDGQAILSVMRDITDRKQLEREILHAVEREQERIGQDIHDGLCQLLVAAKYRVAMLERMLTRDSNSREAFGIEQMLNEAIAHARGLARGLNPVKLSGNGLVHALEELASITQASKSVRCTFRCLSPVDIPGHVIANHLYRIAQESVQNAMKHGNAKRIMITLRNGGRLILTIKDDGTGLPEGNCKIDGAGLNNMRTRAAMIGATLKISKRRGGGTAVACMLNPTLLRNHVHTH